MFVVGYLEIKTGILSKLKFDTTPCDYKKVNDNNYEGSQIEMSLKNYQSLVKNLNYQNKFINESKKNEIKITLSNDKTEFKTVSKTK